MKQRDRLNVGTTHGTGLLRAKKDLNDGLPHTMKPMRERSATDIKREMYRIGAAVLESLGPKFTELLARDRERRAWYTGTQIRIPMHEEQIVESMKSDPVGVSAAFQNSFANVARRVFSAAQHENATLGQYTYEQLTHRVLHLREQIREVTEDKADVNSMEAFLIGGINTASKYSWGLVRSIPIIFHQQFGRAPSQEEYVQLLKDGERFITDAAFMHVNAHHDLNGIGEGFVGTRVDEKFLPLEFFEISQDVAGIFTLNLREEFLQMFEQFQLQKASESLDVDPEDRFGCLAMYATTHNPITERRQTFPHIMYSYYAELAEKAIGPNLDVYTTTMIKRVEETKGMTTPSQ